MKLSQEDIQFIDTYLKNSGVMYFDIRMEMLDHVATAVEQKMDAEKLDFYDAFKSYMVTNKKEVLKSNPKIIKLTCIALKNYFFYFFTPKAILSVLMVYLFFKGLTLFFSVEKINYYGSTVVFFVVMFAYLFYYFKTKNNKIRFSSLDTISGLTFIFYQGVILFNNPIRFGQQNNSWLLVVFISSLIVFVFFYQNEEKKVKESELFKQTK